MAGHLTDDKPLPEPMMARFLRIHFYNTDWAQMINKSALWMLMTWCIKHQGINSHNADHHLVASTGVPVINDLIQWGLCPLINLFCMCFGDF